MPKVLEELMGQYKTLVEKDDPGSYALAELEDAIWERHKKITGRGTSKTAERRDFFTSKFGGQSSYYERRGTILRSGEWAWLCFAAIDKGDLSYSGAGLLLTVVKNVSRSTGVAPEVILEKALEAYDGTAKSLKGLEGKVKRKSDRRVVDEAAPFSPNLTVASKEFKAKIHSVVKRYLDAVFQSNSVTDHYKGQLEDEFMASIDVTIDEMRRNIHSSKRYARNEIMTTVSEADFNLACEVLGCSFVYGQKLTSKDEQLIKRRHMRRAAELHPDSNAGEFKDEYDLVNKANETLSAYIRIRKEAS